MIEYTIDYFKVDRKRCECHDCGYWRNAYESWLNEDGFEINYSSTLTHLIQYAGRYCENYASDLFLIWSCLVERFKNKDYTGEKLILGFRESGVDKNESVVRNYNENRYYYRKIVTVEIEVKDGRLDMYM